MGLVLAGVGVLQLPENGSHERDTKLIALNCTEPSRSPSHNTPLVRVK